MKSSIVERSLAESVLVDPQTEREAAAAKAAQFWRNEALRLRGNRSLNLNEFYWAHVVRPFCMANGDHGARAEKAQHDMWKARFLPSWAKSTKQLSRDDFALFVDRCLQDAAENNVVLFYPSEIE